MTCVKSAIDLTILSIYSTKRGNYLPVEIPLPSGQAMLSDLLKYLQCQFYSDANIYRYARSVDDKMLSSFLERHSI